MFQGHEDSALPLACSIVEQLASHIDCNAVRRERLFRRQLEKTIEVLEHTRHSFRSKQLKKLREEIEGVLRTE